MVALLWEGNCRGPHTHQESNDRFFPSSSTLYRLLMPDVTNVPSLSLFWWHVKHFASSGFNRVSVLSRVPNKWAMTVSLGPKKHSWTEASFPRALSVQEFETCFCAEAEDPGFQTVISSYPPPLPPRSAVFVIPVLTDEAEKAQLWRRCANPC